MARLDIYKNLGAGKAKTPFVLDVQSHHIGDFGRHVVIPLIRTSAFPQENLPSDLAPKFEIQGIEVMLQPVYMASVPDSMLGEKVGSLANTHAEYKVTSALGRLFGRY
jgi:toxin CcdB